MTLSAFARKWTHPNYPPEQLTESDLRAAEATLGFRFPVDYMTQVLQVGLPSPTIALLDSVVEGELDLSVVNDFFAPNDIVTLTGDWHSAGMPDYLIGFADDCSGNLFCFHTTESGVWFFDHDHGTTDVVAPSFSAWINAQVAIEPLPRS
jgi:hypothetical protein